jgi:hypothetical protein
MELSEQIDFIDDVRPSSQGDPEYYVHWKTFTSRVPSWERASDLPGCDNQIDAFTSREEQHQQEITRKARQDEANIRAVFPDRGSRMRADAVRSQETRERGRKLSLTVSITEPVLFQRQTFDCVQIEKHLADRIPFEHIGDFKNNGLSLNFVPVAIVDRRFESTGTMYGVRGARDEKKVVWLSSQQCAQLCPDLIIQFLSAQIAKHMGIDEVP